MLNPGTVLQQRYEIIEAIGKGGMGAVFLAKDTRLGNRVALKETLFTDESLRRAFEREARLLAGLQHPALPRVMDHFTEDDGQFLVMEYIAGDDLETLFQRHGPFSLSDALDWADQLLDALVYLHGQEPPVVHRDIKPHNLKLADGKRVVLLDFGLAKGHAADMTQTSGKSLFGYTPAYAPLEQIRGVGTDPRSDIYSLGATLYHLLTGAAPPDAITRANAIVGAHADPLRPAHKLNPEISPAVSAVLQKAAALHADQRFATAAELRQALADARTAPLETARFEAATIPLTVTPTAPARAEDFVTTPMTDEASEMATAILPPRDSRPEKDYTTKVAAAPAASGARWRYAAGGLLAVSALGATLWVANNRRNSASDTIIIPQRTVIIENSNVSASPEANSNAAPKSTTIIVNPAQPPKPAEPANKPAPQTRQTAPPAGVAAHPPDEPPEPPELRDKPPGGRGNPPPPNGNPAFNDAMRRQIEAAQREADEARQAGDEAKLNSALMKLKILRSLRLNRTRQPPPRPPTKPEP
jgi:serine/threonine protein kinase